MSADTAPISSSNAGFHHFPQLPPELRRAIWMEFLAGIVPRTYRFVPCYPLRFLPSSERSDCHRPPQSGDPIVLVPCAFAKHRPELVRRHPRLKDAFNSLQPFIDSTMLARAAGATCSESRSLMLELLPDALAFRDLRHNGLLEKDKEAVIDLASIPEYVLRFNGARDIFILRADWSDQRNLVALSELNGTTPAAFAAMQHAGLTSGSISRQTVLVSSPWTALPSECRCLSDECADFCRLDSLPRFLETFFPNLRAFYIARLTKEDYWDNPKDDADPPADAVCRCDEGHPTWPTILSGDTDDESVIYNERARCSFFPLRRVEQTRRWYRSYFPYYKALSHLDIKFIRRMEKE
ncbi:hypothetical protein BX600DRAFT_433071 [Xylariales sp. PMI_506]|nr:hypothetical protein BX600DRAFT_433071 [Xylariales sp. PMI_506]